MKKKGIDVSKEESVAEDTENEGDDEIDEEFSFSYIESDEETSDAKIEHAVTFTPPTSPGAAMQQAMDSMSLTPTKKKSSRKEVVSVPAPILKPPVYPQPRYQSCSTNVSFPFVQYAYKESRRNYIAVEFLVYMLGTSHYRPMLMDPTTLALETVFPAPFFDQERHRNHYIIEEENDSKHKAYKKAVTDLREEGGWLNQVVSKPQIVKLKEEVEEEIDEWDLIPVKNQDAEVTACTGSRSVLFILRVVLLCKRREANKFKTGKIKIAAFNKTPNYGKNDFNRNNKQARREEASPSNLQASNQLENSHRNPTSAARKAAKEQKEREQMEKENTGFFQNMFFPRTDSDNMSL